MAGPDAASPAKAESARVAAPTAESSGNALGPMQELTISGSLAFASVGNAGPRQLLALQRSAGNCAVSKLVHGLQRAPTVVPEVREISTEELLKLAREHPERVLITELAEGERLVFDNSWRSGGGKGQVAAFEDTATKKIRVAPGRLPAPVKDQLYQTLAAANKASGETAAAERSAAKAAQRRNAGLAETPASPSAIEEAGGGSSKEKLGSAKTELPEAKGGGSEAKLGSAKTELPQATGGSSEAKLGSAKTEVAGVEAKAGSTETKLGVAETQVAAAEIKAEGAAAAAGIKVEGAALKGARWGRVARVSKWIIKLGMPGPWDVFFMFISAFGSIAEAKEQLRAGAYSLGFGKGLAASLLNQDPVDAMFLVADPEIGERVAGFEGVRERGSNAGIAAGYKFGQSLSAEQRQGFLDELKSELSASNKLRYLTGEFRRDSTDMGIALRPTVKKLLAEAARQEEERRAWQEALRSSRKRLGEV